jgi:hypothetical protein
MHILYVDESGDGGFSSKNIYQLNTTPSRYFIRTGLIIHDYKWLSINKQIDRFKYSRKIPLNIELHATEILNGYKKIKGKTVSLPNWFGANYPSRNDRIKLLKDLCTLIASLNVTLIFIIIDKANIDKTRIDFKTIPQTKSWEFLIERYNLFLQNQTDKKGIIISDAIETALEKKHREFAKAIFAQSIHVKEHHFIESILFEPSESSNLLQIADIASYAIGRKYNSDDDTYYNVLKSKIFTLNYKIDGYGEKIWPEIPSSE